MTWGLVGAAAAIFALVALRDITARTIDDLLLAVLGTLWLGLSVLQGADAAAMAFHGLVALAAFAALAGLFALGWMAGGDVKLAAVVFLWAGPEHAVGMVAIVAMAGGVVALGCLMADWLRRLPLPAAVGNGLHLMSATRGVPYGVALSFGGILAALTYPGGGGG